MYVSIDESDFTDNSEEALELFPPQFVSSYSSTDSNLTSHIPISNTHPCPSLTASPDKDDVAFIICGIFVPIVCFLVAACNAIKCVVLCNRRLLSEPCYIYMTAMSASHALTLTFEGAMLIGAHYFNGTSLFEASFPWLWAVFSYMLTLSMCLFVALTIETYFYVSCIGPPLKSEKLASRQKWARFIIAAVVILVFTLNMPRMIVFKYDQDTGCVEHRWPTQPRSWFSVYNYVRMLVFNVGSVVALLVFHILLVCFLCKTSSPKSSMIAENRRRTADLQRLSLALVLSVMFCIFVETVTLLLNPISFSIFWRHFHSYKWWKQSNSLLVHPTTTTGICFAMIAAEYFVILLFSLVFNTTFRQLFLAKVPSCLRHFHETMMEDRLSEYADRMDRERLQRHADIRRLRSSIHEHPYSYTPRVSLMSTVSGPLIVNNKR